MPNGLKVLNNIEVARAAGKRLRNRIIAGALRKRFPWLGTGAAIDYHDECVRLAEFYEEVSRDDQHL
jgi:hypothetical protein